MNESSTCGRHSRKKKSGWGSRTQRYDRIILARFFLVVCCWRLVLFSFQFWTICAKKNQISSFTLDSSEAVNAVDHGGGDPRLRLVILLRLNLSWMVDGVDDVNMTYCKPLYSRAEDACFQKQKTRSPMVVLFLPWPFSPPLTLHTSRSLCRLSLFSYIWFLRGCAKKEPMVNDFMYLIFFFLHTASRDYCSGMGHLWTWSFVIFMRSVPTPDYKAKDEEEGRKKLPSIRNHRISPTFVGILNDLMYAITLLTCCSSHQLRVYSLICSFFGSPNQLLQCIMCPCVLLPCSCTHTNPLITDIARAPSSRQF